MPVDDDQAVVTVRQALVVVVLRQAMVVTVVMLRQAVVVMVVVVVRQALVKADGSEALSSKTTTLRPRPRLQGTSTCPRAFLIPVMLISSRYNYFDVSNNKEWFYKRQPRRKQELDSQRQGQDRHVVASGQGQDLT